MRISDWSSDVCSSDLSAGQLRLHFLEGGPGLILVAGGARGLDLLHEGADAADARAVDLRPAIVAEDAFLCLRGVRHRQFPSSRTRRDRTSVGWGKSGGVSVDLGGCRINKKKKK